MGRIIPKYLLNKCVNKKASSWSKGLFFCPTYYMYIIFSFKSD